MDEIDSGLVTGLLALSAVADTQSFGRAADRLGKTQSGVSRAIARLEEKLNARLVQRTSRYVELTEAGALLLARSIPHLDGLKNAAAEIVGVNGAVRGTMRIASDALFARLMLAPHLTKFLLANPLLELKIETRNQLSEFASEGFDLAVRFGDAPSSTLVCRRILSARVLTVVSPSYLDRYSKPRHPEDLIRNKHECILAIDPSTGKAFDWEFWRGSEKLTVNVQGNLTVADAGTKLGACLAGYGIAQIIDIGLDDYIKTGQLINLFPDWPDERFPLFVYYPSRNHVSAKVRAFIDFVVNSLSEEGACSAPRVETDTHYKSASFHTKRS